MDKSNRKLSIVYNKQNNRSDSISSSAKQASIIKSKQIFQHIEQEKSHENSLSRKQPAQIN